MIWKGCNWTAPGYGRSLSVIMRKLFLLWILLIIFPPVVGCSAKRKATSRERVSASVRERRRVDASFSDVVGRGAWIGASTDLLELRPADPARPMVIDGRVFDNVVMSRKRDTASAMAMGTREVRSGIVTDDRAKATIEGSSRASDVETRRTPVWLWAMLAVVGVAGVYFAPRLAKGLAGHFKRSE